MGFKLVSRYRTMLHGKYRLFSSYLAGIGFLPERPVMRTPFSFMWGSLGWLFSGMVFINRLSSLSLVDFDATRSIFSVKYFEEITGSLDPFNDGNCYAEFDSEPMSETSVRRVPIDMI